MNKGLVIAFADLALWAGPSVAAGPFDGNWKGSTVSNDCPGAVAAAIMDGKFAGSIGFPRRTVSMSGDVAPDGKLNAKLGTDLVLQGSFAANAFEGSFSYKPCGGTVPVKMQRG